MVCGGEETTVSGGVPCGESGDEDSVGVRHLSCPPCEGASLDGYVQL